jgi:hypothetical protein
VGQLIKEIEIIRIRWRPWHPKAPDQSNVATPSLQSHERGWATETRDAVYRLLAASDLPGASAVEVKSFDLIGSDAFQLIFRTPYFEGDFGLFISSRMKFDPDLFSSDAQPDPIEVARFIVDYVLVEPADGSSARSKPDRAGVFWRREGLDPREGEADTRG